MSSTFCSYTRAGGQYLKYHIPLCSESELQDVESVTAQWQKVSFCYDHRGPILYNSIFNVWLQRSGSWKEQKAQSPYMWRWSQKCLGLTVLLT